jgi:hypothetical protein
MPSLSWQLLLRGGYLADPFMRQIVLAMDVFAFRAFLRSFPRHVVR